MHFIMRYCPQLNVFLSSLSLKIAVVQIRALKNCIKVLKVKPTCLWKFPRTVKCSYFYKHSQQCFQSCSLLQMSASSKQKLNQLRCTLLKTQLFLLSKLQINFKATKIITIENFQRDYQPSKTLVRSKSSIQLIVKSVNIALQPTLIKTFYFRNYF